VDDESFFTLFSELPAATHSDAVAHDTSTSWLKMARPGLGVGVIDQVVPFHTSTNVEDDVSSPAEYPTAVHFELRHDTPPSALSVAPLGLVTGVIDQVVPFHTMASD
jgi:hypothetical protein